MTDSEEVKNKFDSLFKQYEIDKEYFNEIEFGIMPNHLAQKISSQLNININGAKLKVTNKKLNHIFKVHDGKTEMGRVKEEERGQIPVNRDDFYLIHNIIVGHDEYRKADPDHYGNPSIYFIKKINNIHYWVCMTYTTKRDHRTGEIKKRLTVSTMFKKRA